MDAFSSSITDTIDSLSNSLVSIHGRRGYPLSGAVWADGVIITTNRAVGRGDSIHVGLPDGETVEAELIGRAPNVDLAALRLSSESLTTPTWVEYRKTKGRPNYAAPWATS